MITAFWNCYKFLPLCTETASNVKLYFCSDNYHHVLPRKIILALLQLFDGQLDKIRLQKLLFLFTTRQAKADYDFIPYRFDCYSYSANADMTAMVRKDISNETKESFCKSDKTDYLKFLKPEDRKIITEVKTVYGKMVGNALMKHTYLNYPFYAIKSEVAEKILNADELQEVKKANPQNTATVLFTIGYEGISLEEYLVRLLKNDVKVLVDVRITNEAEIWV